MKPRTTTRRAMSLGEILAEIKLCSGTQFDLPPPVARKSSLARLRMGWKRLPRLPKAPATRLRRPKHISRPSLSSHHVGLVAHSTPQASGLRA